MTKNWEKGKKELRRTEERDFSSDHSKKKKLKPVEKSKYRLRSFDFNEEA